MLVSNSWGQGIDESIISHRTRETQRDRSAWAEMSAGSRRYSWGMRPTHEADGLEAVWIIT